MRNLIKNSFTIFILAGLSVLLFSCEKDAKYKDYVYPAPSVEEIYPATGYVASQVAILGHNFGDRIEPIKVFFGGVEVENIISCNNSRIIVEVPTGAQSGDVTLQVWTHTLESAGQFVVIPTPVINSIVSSNAGGELFAEGGDEITIIGSAFGSEKEDVTVTINNKTAEVLSVMENEITAKVPDNYGSGLVVVNVKGYEVEGTALIDPSTTGDVTRLFLKNYAQPFQRGDTGDGEWGSALYWIFNANANSGSSLQFTDDVPDGVLALIGNGKWNGSMYQLVTLPAGNYQFKVHVVEDTKTSGRYGARFGVLKGEVNFPDMSEINHGGTKIWEFNDMSNVLCDMNIANQAGTTPITYTCSVTLSETTRTTIGFATMLAGGNNVKISNIEIIRN